MAHDTKCGKPGVPAVESMNYIIYFLFELIQRTGWDHAWPTSTWFLSIAAQLKSSFKTKKIAHNLLDLKDVHCLSVRSGLARSNATKEQPTEGPAGRIPSCPQNHDEQHLHEDRALIHISNGKCHTRNEASGFTSILGQNGATKRF